MLNITSNCHLNENIVIIDVNENIVKGNYA